MAEKQPNIPTSGMTNSHPMNLRDSQYPFMLNGNIQTDISGPVTLTNEHSNILCYNYPEGFKAIGSLYVPEDGIEYIWLVNPDTEQSLFGYLNEYVYIDPQDTPGPDKCDTCGTINTEATPLEDQQQVPTCQFTCVTSSDCLNFSIDFPIRKAVIKKDDCGTSIYFTDFRNPVRVFKLTPQRTIDPSQLVVDFYTGDCLNNQGEPVECVEPNQLNSDCECVNESGTVIYRCTCCEPHYKDPCASDGLDCTKIRLFPKVSHICVEPGPVVPGGNLRAGTYQLAVAYADQNGERATRTFAASNPVSVFNPTYTVTDQLDYPTGLAVKFFIKDLDSSLYKFIDVFVIATINNTSSVKQFSSIDISSLSNGTLEYVVSDFEKGKDVTIDSVLQVFPVYEKAQEITSAGDSILLGNLTGPRDLNLQKAVIGLSPSIRWQTSEANEWFYKDGMNAANYRSYLRDEVYALGIVFERSNTLDTCAYPLIGRAANTNFTPLDANNNPLYFFQGEWIPTKSYLTQNILLEIPYDIVIHNGIYYRAILGSLNQEPPNATYWAVFDAEANLCVDDLETISNNDIFQEPGCEHGDKSDEGSSSDGGPTYTIRWQVYNTACNAGKTCNPVLQGVQCVDEVETILCRSYRYSVPTSSATWPASAGGDVTFTLTVDPTTLGIFEGALVSDAAGLVPAGSILVGPISVGNTITVNVPSPILAQNTPVTISFSTDCDDATACSSAVTCNPADCYINVANQCIPCVDNYPTLLADVIHCNPLWNPLINYIVGNEVVYTDPIVGVTYTYTAVAPNTNQAPSAGGVINVNWTQSVDAASGSCDCPVWPPETDPGCASGSVRTKSDALAYFDANGEYLLCIDATLTGYDSSFADPYVIKSESSPRKILDASTKAWCLYDIVGGTNPPSEDSIQNLIIDPQDPTQDFQNGTKGPTDPVCLVGLFKIYPTGQPILDYMFPGVNMPTTEPENYDPVNAIAGFNPSPEGKCNDYGPSAPLMYMLGHDVTIPASEPPCDGCSDCDTTSWEPDYWDIGPAATMIGEVNNSKYQSYWYSFTSTALQPTIIIKTKIAYKFGEILGLGAADDYQQQGDIRIDVYEGDPLIVPPTYSTGKDSVNPATYYYDTGTPENDWGVLVIGDVANSSNQPTAAGQLPLIPGTIYYVHIYMLQQGVDKLDKAPIPNPNKTDNCIQYDPPEDCDPCGSCCPCYFANYAWMNLCMNSMTCSPEDSRIVSLPETWQVDCEYKLYFRHTKVIDAGCDLQTFEYGGFGYHQSENRTYPSNKMVWGDLCGKPIRHFRMPDCLVTYVQDHNPLITIDPNTGLASNSGGFNPGRTAKIYPLGVRIDPDMVRAWLDWAALPEAGGGGGLITQEERDDITGYKIVRANRVGNKSIVAKGLLFDMWRYREFDWYNSSTSNLLTYYPSYPFNDFDADGFLNNSGNAFTHPFAGNGNNRFAFLSPDTTFNSPVIGTEIKFEAINFGDALGNFYTVRDHPKYVLLSQGGIALAAALAAVQLSADLLVLIGQLLGPTWDAGLSTSYPVGAIVGLVGAALNLAPKFFIYAQQWRDLILNFGVPKNFAKYYAAVGNYHSSGTLGAIENIGNKRRLIKNSSYLLAGNLTLSDEGVLSKINNYQREDSVYLFLGDAVFYNDPGLILKDPYLRDTSRFIMSDNTDGRQCSSNDRRSQVASYYASVKYNVPDQYGSIHDLEWLYTGTCVNLNDPTASVCDVVYGGDTFICRMTQKRKIPFFIDNPVGSTSVVDFQYQRISNITNATYYFNSVGESIASSSSIQFVPVEHRFDCETTGSGLYLNGTIYLFSYGITSFITESDFNLNFRYAENTTTKDFYPHNSDIENWTQEINIPIEVPNAYLYYRGYSKQNKENFFCTQPIIYSNDECITTYRNRVINSIPDEDSDFYTDPWRVFLGNDYHDFPLVNGQLVGMDGIEREKVLLRFNNTSLVFNAYYTITTDAGQAQIGTGSMFAQKPLEYAKTEIGYGGTQHHAFVSTQYGHFWVDAKRSAVFMLPPGEGGLQEISQSLNTFFNNNLPFAILKAFPDFDVDNNYKQIGLTVGWDNKFDRLFLTKLDYELNPRWFESVNPDNFVTYDDASGFIHCTDASGTCTPIELTDTTYFCNKSWTLGYSPITNSWISYYSFVPNYYIGHDNYFQTGINYPQNGDSSEIGIWNHLITNKSYQVFYGKLYPFITDVVVKDQLINKQLHSIEYQADFLRFQNDYDYFYNPGVTFNKAIIWSENKNSGLLELIPQVSNNLSQGILYPISNPDSTTVLVTRKENNWRFDQFWDLVRNKYNNVPPMIYGCSPYLKDINPTAINYFKPTFERSRLVSDYFTIRLINDQYSNYRIVDKWFLNNTIKSDS